MNEQTQTQQEPNLGWPSDADPTAPAEPMAAARDWNPGIKPILERGERRKGGMAVMLIALLFVALLAGGAWYFLKGHSTAKRLPGAWSMEPTQTTTAKTTAAKSPAASAAKKPNTSPAAPVVHAAEPSSAAQARIVAPPASPLPQIAGLGALPASATSDAARPPQAGASSAESKALPSPITSPAADAALQAEKMIDFQQQLDRLQDTVAALQTRLDADEAQNKPAPSPAATHAAAPPRRGRRERLASRRREEPVSAAVESAPPPTLGAQLLSVDMWAGAPSVVVTSGLPDDTRTRTLRPGDTLHGVTLQSADPATGSATFVSGGKTFTLSTRDGG